MDMKKMFLLGLILVLTLVGNCLADSGSKETEISRLVPLPSNIKIIPPDKGLDPRIIALSGRWEGIWDGIDMPAVFIVESISSTTANILYCWGKSRYIKPDYARRKAKIFFGEKVRIEFPVWVWDRGMRVIDFPLEMSDDLKTLSGKYVGTLSYEVSITMKKIED